VSRCTQIPESRVFVFNSVPAFGCIIVAVKSRTEFVLKFVLDLRTTFKLSLLGSSAFCPAFECKTKAKLLHLSALKEPSRAKSGI
jgi:hypothetical protein